MASPSALAGQRYSKVPWLWQADLEEGRQSIWERTCGSEHHSAWRVTVYEDRAIEEVALVMHARRGNGNDGGQIALSIQPLGCLPQRKWLDMSKLQSNPRRAVADDGDDGA